MYRFIIASSKDIAARLKAGETTVVASKLAATEYAKSLPGKGWARSSRGVYTCKGVCLSFSMAAGKVTISRMAITTGSVMPDEEPVQETPARRVERWGVAFYKSETLGYVRKYGDPEGDGYLEGDYASEEEAIAALHEALVAEGK